MSIPVKQHSNEPVQDRDFLHAYKRLPEKSPATIRFFDRGDYFSLHGSDALFAAREHFKTNNVIKIWKSSGSNTGLELETCYVNNNNFELLLRDLLLVKQYRVEIWRKNKSNEWILVNTGSPGNIGQFEDIIYKSDDDGSSSLNAALVCDPGLIAIQIVSEHNINKLVCAHIDKTARSFIVCSIAFKDNFTDLESLVIHLGPKECLIPMSGGNRDYYNKMIKCLEKNNILISERKKNDFNVDMSCDELNKLIKTSGDQNVANLPELNDTNTIGCLNALIRYLDLLKDSANDKKFKIKSYNLNNYLKLDSGAFRSLNLLPNSQNDESIGASSNRNNSVYGVLNKCSTPQGQRLLMQWIKQPLIDVHKIEERQNVVEILVNDTELRQNLVEDYLKRMPDFQKIEWRFIKNKATLQDCYKIYLAVDTLPKMFESMIRHDGKHAHIIREMFINPLNVLIADLSKFQDMVETTLDFDQIRNHLFLIKSTYVPELEELKERLDSFESQIESIGEKCANELKLKSVKVESNAQNGYYFRIPRKDDSVLRNNKNYTIIDTKKDGIKFQSEKLVRINDEFIEVREEYETKQNTVVQEIITVASGYLDSLQVLNNLIAELDIFVSFANVALDSRIGYVRPKLHELGTGILKFKDTRHPCIELQDGRDFIPNDAEFVKDEKTFCILTGPNMGGKSTYARQIGIILLMAQIGSFVPASQAEMSVCDCILARIGANDCQNKGVSTFMAEMLETSFILKTATQNSFVIIDELGRGTSTYDGFGLAWAISEYLVKQVKCFTIFATHFHELTALSEECKTVFNSHVSAITNDKELVLLYKVKPGVCDQSFGIHVAKLANFPKHVIEYAKEKAKYLEDYSPMLLNDDTEIEDTESHNKKIKYKQETNELIDKCFEQISQLDMNSIDETELIKKIHDEIEREAKQNGNPYFQALVAK